MATYDVFISCKSEDYRYAEEIYDYLKDLGINVFLASRELRRLGESEYRRAISKALRDAYHLIVFASNPEYIESTWVEYEWDMFVNAKLKGKKQGNILTILKDVSTDDIPMDLWKYESFTFESYRENLIKYVETPESIERKKELQRTEEELRRKKKEEEAKARKRAELKSKLEATAEEYKKSVASLQVDANKINSLLKELDITHRECPICGNSVPVDKTVCAVCGWVLSPLEGLADLAYLTEDSDNLRATYTSIYNSYLRFHTSQLEQSTRESNPHKDKSLSKDIEIKSLKDDKNVVSGHKRTQVSPVLNDRSYRIQTADDRKYGIRIADCGKDTVKVAKVMSRFFGRSANSFTSVLQSLPYFSPQSLSKEMADEVMASLNKLGASCGIVHTS